jgi:hypothetical protein
VGTYITTPAISDQTATVKLQVIVANDTEDGAAVTGKNKIFELSGGGGRVMDSQLHRQLGVSYPERQSVSVERLSSWICLA